MLSEGVRLASEGLNSGGRRFCGEIVFFATLLLLVIASY
jgi:hypothetical protein